MARIKKPKYMLSVFKRSPFDGTLKIAEIEDFDFDECPKTLDIVRHGVYKLKSDTQMYAEYTVPKSDTVLRINK